MKIWKAIRTAAARFFGIRQQEREQESEKQQQDDAQNDAQSGESVQAGISSQEEEKGRHRGHRAAGRGRKRTSGRDPDTSGRYHEADP